MDVESSQSNFISVHGKQIWLSTLRTANDNNETISENLEILVNDDLDTRPTRLASLRMLGKKQCNITAIIITKSINFMFVSIKCLMKQQI